MKNKMLNFKGLYGDNDKILQSDFIHCEYIETRSQKHNWKINQHIHTELFQLFLIESGAGKLLVEKQAIDFTAPCLILVPENTLHGFDYSEMVQGTVLTVSPSFIEKLFKTKPQISLELSHLRILPMQEGRGELGFILNLIEKIRAELFDDLLEREVMLASLFTALFTLVFRLSSTHQGQDLAQNKRSLSIFNAFVQQIKASKTPQRKVAEYAQALKISHIHLNRICQEIAQQSALQVINDFFVNEAQKLLLHTSFGVSEIAYQLNFEDAAYFSRLFKKHTRKSPKAFREG